MRPQNFSFDTVLGSSTSEAELFEEIQPYVVSTVEGFNSNVVL